jgi:hypothetical protein
MRRSARIRALYGDPRRRGTTFDNLHFLPTAPPHAELCVFTSRTETTNYFRQLA